MTRRILLPVLFALLLPAAAGAATADRDPSSRPEGRHYILERDHAFDAAERSLLQAAGVEIQRPLGGDRYLVLMRSAAAFSQAAALGLLKSYDETRKIARSAWTEAARPRSLSRLSVLFHDDVEFDEAASAIAAAGGVLASPMTMGFKNLRRIEALVPAQNLQSLAADERVFGIFGPPRRPHALNALAASLSHVTPLFSAPYNLDGSGVILSLFELAAADTAHPQFGGRYISHAFTGGSSSDKLHSTHVAGTIIASGLDPSGTSSSDAARAKGMAPAATLHEFDVLVPFEDLLKAKQDLKLLNSVADNNSWDYSLGWQPSGGTWVWNGGEDYLGGYSLSESSPYDAVAVSPGIPLFVHSAGNDGDHGHPMLNLPWSPHQHVDDKGDTITNEIYCYSQNGSGTDCPASTCPNVGHSLKSGDDFCERTQHPTYGPYNTAGLMSSTKNSVSVGAVDRNGGLTSFSSRGPARDGRIKPELVAKGLSQWSTAPGGGYQSLSGTSMSSPVVTGISGLLAQQYRMTFGGETPNGAMLKTLLIAGADDQVGPTDIDKPGPDYAYGFGLVDAKASVDLILADNGTGSRIRKGTLSQGQQAEFPLITTSGQKVRVVLGWFDPEIYPAADSPSEPTLLNDLDVKIIDPAGNAILPYILDPAQPTLPATRGVNTRDTTEEVEISPKDVVAGVYRVIITATKIRDSKKSTQDFVVVANAPLLAFAPVCTDPFEPNNSPETATAVASGTSLNAGFCQDGDVDFYKFTVPLSGSVGVGITATTTAVKATLLINGVLEVVSKVIAAGTSGSLSYTPLVPPIATPGPTSMLLRVEPIGAIVAPANYSLAITYRDPGRRRSAGH